MIGDLQFDHVLITYHVVYLFIELLIAVPYFLYFEHYAYNIPHNSLQSRWNVYLEVMKRIKQKIILLIVV